jgi:CRP-like cAMP-binding protein
MDNPIYNFFKQYHYLNLSDIVELFNLSRLHSYKSGDIIASQGQKFPYIIAIRKGIIRTSILTTDGEKRSVRFAGEKSFAACAHSIINNAASTEYLEAIEDCKVILINASILKEKTEKNIRLLRLWNDAIMDAFLEAMNRIEFFVTLTPEERYISLLKENPELITRIQQKYLASYIGVTTVSLSRIRSRVSEKKHK